MHLVTALRTTCQFSGQIFIAELPWKDDLAFMINGNIESLLGKLPDEELLKTALVCWRERLVKASANANSDSPALFERDGIHVTEQGISFLINSLALMGLGCTRQAVWEGKTNSKMGALDDEEQKDNVSPMKKAEGAKNAEIEATPNGNAATTAAAANE